MRDRKIRLLTYPARQTNHLTGEVDSSSSDLRGQILVHLHVQGAQLDQVLAKSVGHVVRLTGLAEAAQEVQHGGVGQVEVERVENFSFLLEDFITSVGIVGNEHVVVDLRRVDLLVLGGNKHRSNTNQLELAASNLTDAEVVIQNVAGQEKGFREQIELQVNFSEPINQDTAHLLVDVNLVGHKAGQNGVTHLNPDEN